MKISIISFDLGNNCLGRAYLLGKVLSRHYDVDIHGFVFPYSGNKIWKPCDTNEFYYKVIQGRNFPFFLKSMTDMIRSINGDVIYASKATLPSYGVALLKKFFSLITFKCIFGLLFFSKTSIFYHSMSFFSRIFF